MNKQLYFVFGFLSAVLLVLAVGSASAFDWQKFKLFGDDSDDEGEDDSDETGLSPMPSGSPYSCSANSDIKTRTLRACTSVQSPLGEFTTLRVGSRIDAGNAKFSALIVDGEVSANSMSTDELAAGRILIAASETSMNESYRFMRDPNGGLRLRHLVNGGFGDGVLLLDDLLVEEGLDVGGSVTLTGLTGTGNDYACIDANGRIFRSNTAC